jgi:hypothetical protein
MGRATLDPDDVYEPSDRKSHTIYFVGTRVANYHISEAESLVSNGPGAR